MYSYEENYTYTIHFQKQTIHILYIFRKKTILRTFTFVIYHWKNLKKHPLLAQKKKKK